MASQEEINQLQNQLNDLAKKNNQQAELLQNSGLVPIPKIMIGVPILAWTHEFATSFLNFWTELITLPPTRKFHVGFQFMYRRPVDLAEEELAEIAIESGCTHLLLMDDDIYDVTAKDFFALLDADKEVVGGIMYTSGFPHAMCAFRRFDLTKKVKDQPRIKDSCRLYEVPVAQRVGLQHVDLIPFGFTMIKTSVFGKFKQKPWFKCDTKAPTDSHFADLCIENGIEYYAHFGVWLNHRGVRQDNMHFHSQMGLHEAQKKQSRCIQLTPDEMKKQEMMVQQRIEMAENNYKHEIQNRIKFYEKNIGAPLAVPVKVTPKEIIVQQDPTVKEIEEAEKRRAEFYKNRGSNGAGIVVPATPELAGRGV